MSKFLSNGNYYATDAKAIAIKWAAIEVFQKGKFSFKVFIFTIFPIVFIGRCVEFWSCDVGDCHRSKDSIYGIV
jgi:hypothetical protein